jgi:hypothetical protein
VHRSLPRPNVAIWWVVGAAISLLGLAVSISGGQCLPYFRCGRSSVVGAGGGTAGRDRFSVRSNEAVTFREEHARQRPVALTCPTAQLRLRTLRRFWRVLASRASKGKWSAGAVHAARFSGAFDQLPFLCATAASSWLTRHAGLGRARGSQRGCGCEEGSFSLGGSICRARPRCTSE